MGEHWYSRAGAPAYTIIGANGRERNVTLRDARAHGYVPSVTTILSIIDKPQLTTWLVKQGILAALTLPRAPDEPEDDYLARILSDSGQQAKDAADEGTRIHDAIERSFRGMVVEERYRPHVAGVRDELARLFPGVSDWVAESSFASPDGYGGKVDLHSPSTGIVIDHKGKDGDFSDGKKLAYDQHWQLAPYQRGLRLPTNVCANLFFSRTHPGKVASHVWSIQDIAEGWDVFKNALGVWRAIKRLDPRFVQSEAA